MRKTLTTAAATLLLVFGCSNQEEREPAAASTTAERATASAETPAAPAALEILPSPAGPGAAEPSLFAARDGVILSWLAPVPNTDRHSLLVSKYANGGWSQPRTVVSRNDLFVNWADFPSVVEDANGVLYAHWLQKSGSGTYAYDVRMSTSKDGGATWSESFLLNRDGKQSEHGFATLAPLSGGGIAATWLDGRNMTMGGHDGHEGGGDMTLRYATIDANGTIAGDVELDARTCECCTTGMAIAEKGPVIVYRDRTKDEIRDISMLRNEGANWIAQAPLRKDGWKINGCPVNGPQIDALGNALATAWFTAPEGQSRVYVSFLSGQEAIAVDDGKPIGRVDVVLLDRDTAFVTWLEQTASGAEIRARRVTRDGKRGDSIKIADSGTA
ncbi:MAG TPA: sialidase family protein, partial [Thermoanaerobaculia bacterium]|nr:sialidase family protein [Thermoanaerobaculia bacterium]